MRKERAITAIAACRWSGLTPVVKAELVTLGAKQPMKLAESSPKAWGRGSVAFAPSLNAHWTDTCEPACPITFYSTLSLQGRSEGYKRKRKVHKGIRALA